MTVGSQYVNAADGIQQVKFADGTIWSLTQLNKLVLGTSGNDMLSGTMGSDTFYGTPGTDTLSGGGGYDIYRFGANTGHTVINNLASDGISGPNGEVDFASGIASNQLWFAQSGQDLAVDIMGTSSQITVPGWFGTNARAQAQSFNTADGARLDTQVTQLVSAMATYAANNPRFDPTMTVQAPNDPSLQAAIASAWHH